MSVKRLIKSFVPENYKLSLELDNENKKFEGTVDISGEMTFEADGISLHAKDLTLNSVLVDGKSADFEIRENDEILITQKNLKAGKHLVTIGYSGKITDAMHGIYPCYFETEGVRKNLIATQFESHHAREALPSVDEPEAKATFDVTLTTDTGVEVLGNMPIQSQREENGRLVTTFEQTPRMSTYLLAWVVGELQSISGKTKSGVDVKVYSTKAQNIKSLDFALDHSIKSIDFFEEYFGVPYPLPKSDQVALPDFSSGAMENWGLVTYRETALLADPDNVTIAAKQRIATVISHELSHMWFGNLVTMKWWNNLWLNESFATLMEYVAVDAIWPEWNIWNEFSSYESVLALRRDAADGVQPVQVEVNHPDEISSLFDGAIVYAKGARLMRMCQEFIGHEDFRQGLSSYFKEFAYKNTEASDLWRHLSASSGEDITTIMNQWISTSGYPVVSVSPTGLSQKQFFIGPHQPSDKIWPIPLASNSDKLPKLLTEETLEVNIPEKTRLNIKDSSHFITHYSEDHLSNLLANLDEVDELGRMQLLHEQTLLARGEIVSSANLINLLEAYRGEQSDYVWEIMSMALGELKKFVETDEAAETKLKAFAKDLAKEQFERLGWDEKPGESASDTKLRSTVLAMMIYSEDKSISEEVDRRYASGIESINAEIRPLIIGSHIKRSKGIDQIKSLLEIYGSSASGHLKDDICSGLTSAKQPDQISLILETLTNKEVIRPQDIYQWFAYMVRSRYGKEATLKWMISSWDWIVDTFQGDKSYDNFPRYAAAGATTRQYYEVYHDFFEPKKTIPALTRTIEIGETEILGRLELIERDGDAVRSRLMSL